MRAVYEPIGLCANQQDRRKCKTVIGIDTGRRLELASWDHVDQSH